MPRRELSRCRALITGASSGIGRELALALAGQGAALWLTARRAELLVQIAEECRRVGAAETHQMPGDIADSETRARLAEQVESNWAALDVLVNNAGVSAHGRFDESDEATLRRVMEVNFFAATELTRRLLPLLRCGREPAILNVGSVLGHRGAPMNAEYCASKFALRGWTESLRAELAGEGIEVLLASPGTTSSEFFDHLLAKRRELPWGNSGAVTPEQVAQQLLRQLQRGRRETFPNWRGRALTLVNRLAPGVVDAAMRRYGRRSVDETSTAANEQ